MDKHITSLEITDICYGTYGTGKYENKLIYVKDTVPGDIVSVRIKRKRKGIHYASVTEMLKKSELRAQSDCPHFPECGGCLFRDITYENQLILKNRLLLNELKHQDIYAEPEAIIPSPTTLYYRNKMEFTFGTKDGSIILGMHKKGDFSTVINTPECRLQSTKSSRIREIIIDWANKNNLISYNPRTHEGTLRHLLIREGKNTGQIIIALITAHENLPDLELLSEILKKEITELVGFSLVINSNIADTVTYEQQITITGQNYFLEKLDERHYEVSLSSFFQTNSKGTEVLYRHLKDIVNTIPTETVLDLYCGAGSIGIYIADLKKEIIGVELHAQSILNAEINKTLNNLTNISYHHKDVRLFLKEFNYDKENTLAIIDPPREGLHPKTRKMLLEHALPWLIYVSCNPKTLAIDLKYLQEGYTISCLQPFDLFPYTPHQESIALLIKKV
ncbi:MAG: 23S rRNA (uracil(1939)-C(5))-methyltransferase RlmD [Candidatus Margulisiibacteriota bacterium]|nr:MAG: 23S rRNA (uracil(1939)-C(5))-methyltransferase RlmD [Candidatus Margulisiibacteriota bacterium]